MKKLLFLCIVCFSMGFGRPVYHTFLYDNIEVVATNSDSSIAKKIAVLSDVYLEKVLIEIPTLCSKSIKIVIAPNEDEFHHLTGEKIPEWGAAITILNPPKIILKSPRFDVNARLKGKQILLHEIAHFVLQQASNNNHLPRWFHEGFAITTSNEMTYKRRRLATRLLAKKETISFRQIDQLLSFYPVKAEIVYAQCGSAVGFFNKLTKGKGTQNLLSALQNGLSFPLAFQKTTGFTVAEFEQHWKESGKDPFAYGWILWYTDEIIWGLLPFLVLSVFWLKKRRNRYILRRWENEESVPTKQDLEMYEA